MLLAGLVQAGVHDEPLAALGFLTRLVEGAGGGATGATGARASIGGSGSGSGTAAPARTLTQLKADPEAAADIAAHIVALVPLKTPLRPAAE